MQIDVSFWRDSFPKFMINDGWPGWQVLLKSFLQRAEGKTSIFPLKTLGFGFIYVPNLSRLHQKFKFQ